MRITFHIGRYTVTIIVYERKKKQPPLCQVTAVFVVRENHR